MKFTVGDMVGVLWEAGAACPFAGIWGHPLFFCGGVRGAHLFGFLCCGFAAFVFVLCRVHS